MRKSTKNLFGNKYNLREKYAICALKNLRRRKTELFLKRNREMRQALKADLKTHVGCFLPFIADFLESHVQPFLYQPFLRRQVADFGEIALERSQTPACNEAISSIEQT
jgi:hypothetical protein